VTELGSSKALIMLALPPVERDAFAEEVHEVNGEEKTVSDMSKRELEKAVRERAEALAKVAQMEAVIEDARKVADKSAERIKAADDEVIRLNTEAEIRMAELERLRNAEPAPLLEEQGQQTLEAIRQEAAAEARKEAEAELRKKIKDTADAKKKAEAELNFAKQKAERDKAEANERIVALEKKLAAASSESVTIFKTHFENAQGCVNSMLGCIMKLNDAPETRDKLATALRTLCEKAIQGLPAPQIEAPYGGEGAKIPKGGDET
jgi:chromosome segregation ATPase